MKIDIDDTDLYLMLGSYMRYALGRKSYIVGACCDTLEQLVPKLPIEHMREAIMLELGKELRESTLGMDMDKERWQECYNRLCLAEANKKGIE